MFTFWGKKLPYLEREDLSIRISEVSSLCSVNLPHFILINFHHVVTERIK